MYVWAVDDDAKTASVTLTTAVTNGQVQIENGNVYSYTTTEDVTLNFNDKGYMDIALKVTTTLGAVNEYTLRIYKKTADSRLGSLTVDKLEYKPTGIIIGENYNVTYDKTTGKYVAKITYDTNYVQVNAVAASTSSKVAIRPDEATAKSDSMSGMPFDMRNVSITADTTTLYIAVTPADTSYPQGVYQLDIIRMSANTAIKVTYGGEELSQNADGEYEYTLPASTDGTDNTTQKLVAEGVIVDGDNVTTDESIKLTISTSSTFYVNGDATYTDEMDVKATQPKANAVYIHVKQKTEQKRRLR